MCGWMPMSPMFVAAVRRRSWKAHGFVAFIFLSIRSLARENPPFHRGKISLSK
jgi:hypothetical protein